MAPKASRPPPMAAPWQGACSPQTPRGYAPLWPLDAATGPPLAVRQLGGGDLKFEKLWWIAGLSGGQRSVARRAVHTLVWAGSLSTGQG
jgi:hypothetical protein